MAYLACLRLLIRPLRASRLTFTARSYDRGQQWYKKRANPLCMRETNTYVKSWSLDPF